MPPISENKTPLLKPFFPAMLPIVGAELYKQVVERYRDLYSNHDLPANTYLQKHLLKGILPGLAFYQCIRAKGESQSKALRRIDLTFEQLYVDNIRQMKAIGRLPFIYPLLRVVIKPVMRQYPPEGWVMEWNQNDSLAIRFTMKSCYYFDTLSKYGSPELTASYCRVDDLVYGNMSRDIVWQRTKTIGRGDSICDFCFARANH